MSRIAQLRVMSDDAVARLVASIDCEEGTAEVLEALSQAGFVRIPKEEIAVTVRFHAGGVCRLRGLPDSIQRLEREVSGRALVTRWVAA